MKRLFTVCYLWLLQDNHCDEKILSVPRYAFSESKAYCYPSIPTMCQAVGQAFVI